jgi:hypothetical protein
MDNEAAEKGAPLIRQWLVLKENSVEVHLGVTYLLGTRAGRKLESGRTGFINR